MVTLAISCTVPFSVVLGEVRSVLLESHFLEKKIEKKQLIKANDIV